MPKGELDVGRALKLEWSWRLIAIHCCLLALFLLKAVIHFKMALFIVIAFCIILWLGQELDTHKHCWNSACKCQSDICTLPSPFGAKTNLDWENQSGVLIEQSWKCSFSSAFPGMAECWKMLQWMDALTDPLFSQVIPLHLPPAFSSVEIFHRRHMAKIKSSPWKVGNSQTCALNSNNDGKQIKRAGNKPSFLKEGFTQGVFISNPCCVLFFPGSLKALADIICEYPSIHKRYRAKENLFI